MNANTLDLVSASIHGSGSVTTEFHVGMYVCVGVD